MSSRCLTSASAWLSCVAALAALLVGCEREQREFTTVRPADTPPAENAMNNLVAGRTDFALRARQEHTYQDNAYQLAQGQALYSAFNCVGCHAHGGGDVGPALMDDKWIYGGEIDQVYLSIAQGRPNGMPAFAGLVPPQQMWQLAAYVRSLSGYGPKSARPGRDDHLSTPAPQEARRPPAVLAGRDDS
jgi:cytochrome c oxidase cbb3-type subunit 3